MCWTDVEKNEVVADAAKPLDVRLLNLDDPYRQQLGAGERTADWLNEDGWSTDGISKSEAEFYAGAMMMVKNFVEMYLENTQGSGKFYHCKANCEAPSMGECGLEAANGISTLREVTDAWRHENSDRKKLSPQGSADDIRHDWEANRAGQEAAARGDRCYDACRCRFPYKGMYLSRVTCPMCPKAAVKPFGASGKLRVRHRHATQAGEAYSTAWSVLYPRWNVG